MYWVKTFLGSYINIDNLDRLSIVKEGREHAICGSKLNSEDRFLLYEFQTDEEAQEYLDNLIHKAMKGF